jgi:hypothetical protein
MVEIKAEKLKYYQSLAPLNGVGMELLLFDIEAIIESKKVEFNLCMDGRN